MPFAFVREVVVFVFLMFATTTTAERAVVAVSFAAAIVCFSVSVFLFNDIK